MHYHILTEYITSSIPECFSPRIGDNLQKAWSNFSVSHFTRQLLQYNIYCIYYT